MVKANKKLLSFLMEANKRKVFLLGGAGSGKSWSIAQHILLNKLLKEQDIRILVVRKTLPSLRASAYQLMLDLVSEYKIPVRLNKSDMTMKYNNNILMFKSIDDPEKIKSLEINYVWVEEATDINQDDYLQLNLRTRRKTKDVNNQLYFSFNPIDEQNYLYDIVETPSDDVIVSRSSYKDNPFLDKAYIDQLLGLESIDSTYHKIYTLGEWATPTNIIYSNFDIVSELPDNFDETIYGLDFGYNNNTALIEINIKDEVIYERQLIYESKLTNSDLIEKLQGIIKEKNRCIYADCAEPNRIEEIQRAGFNVYPSDKSVKDGIDAVKRKEIHIHKASDDLIKEKRGYKWKEDKDSNVLDEPVKFNDHLMDAERYAIYTHTKKIVPDIRII